MATTDQLRKAERHTPGTLSLHAYPRERYLAELEAAGQSGLRALSKVELYKRVIAAGIKIVPDWHKNNQ